MRISSNLSSCTQVIQTARLQIDNRWVTLIDTPGFDDTDRTDADILKLIADYLAETYQNDMLLTGVIMLQPINANRVQGSERRRTRLFEKVCGPNAYGNIVIATTMWSDLESEAVGMERMRERVREVSFWGAMVDKGAQVVKHDNTPRSARNIIKMLVNKRAIPLQMQQELVQNGGMIGQTSAGRQLDQDLGEVSARFQKDIDELKRERVQNAEEMRELREQLERTRREREELRKSKASFSILIPTWLSTLITAGGVAITSAACVIL
ncbi:Nn.00g062310.m01.CDS01 [Neocucurbitaria sp. VM-36]